MKGNDGEEYRSAFAIADEMTMDNNESWLDGQVDEMKKMYGTDYVSHGFVDIEIPDAVIASVLRQHMSAGVVQAEGVRQ